MGRFRAGEIVLVDWRDALPKEPNKRRPAVVVEDEALFDDAYPNVIVVPLTEDARLAIAELSVVIEPSAANGCPNRCWAVAHLVTTASKARVTATGSRVTGDEVGAIRERIGLTLGLPP